MPLALLVLQRCRGSGAVWLGERRLGPGGGRMTVRESDDRVAYPFAGGLEGDELLACKLQVDARIEPGRVYRLRPTNQRCWLFHGKPMRLLEIRAASHCYRMKFDLSPEEIPDADDERCRCVYTDSWQPAALALTLVPMESDRRMMHMMALCGLDPGIAALRDAPCDSRIEAARQRCRKCPDEHLCDEWLAGRETGDDGFCPNAPTFRRLAEEAGGGLASSHRPA